MKNANCGRIGQKSGCKKSEKPVKKNNPSHFKARSALTDRRESDNNNKSVTRKVTTMKMNKLTLIKMKQLTMKIIQCQQTIH